MKEERGDTMTLIETIKAAKEGDRYAQYCLSHIYAHGLGVRQNSEKAAKWARLASEEETE